MAQRTEDVRKNFDHGNNFHKTRDNIKGVDDVIEIDFDSDSDYDEDSAYIPIMVKMKDSDSRDYGYKVNPDNNQDNMLIEDIN